MEHLPQDPIMLYSYINTMLRDRFKSLDALCDDLDIDRAALEKKLSVVGMIYNKETNQFI